MIERSASVARRMGGVTRVTVHKSAEIPAPAEQVWDLIRDWAGMLRWWLPGVQGGIEVPALTRCDLVGEPSSVPRTRHIKVSNGPVAVETVVYQNDQTRRIHYTKADDQTITGYLATTYVDDLDGTRCVVHISSAFDVLDPAARTGAAARFEAIYAAMFEGYRRYLAEPAQGRDSPGRQDR